MATTTTSRRAVTADAPAPSSTYGSFPCCGDRSQFPVDDAPEQAYNRTCPKCAKSWTIIRHTLEVMGIGRKDSIEWRFTHPVFHATGTRNR
jgi:hypothetical protein